MENERKEKQKEKKREGQPTLAALMEERLLGSMPTDEVGVPPEAPPPHPSAHREDDRTKIRPFKGTSLAPRCHNGVFNTIVPLCALCWPAHTARSWRPSQ